MSDQVLKDVRKTYDYRQDQSGRGVIVLKCQHPPSATTSLWVDGRLRSLLQNTTLGPLCLNGDGHVLMCHCRHPNLLAVNRHVFVSRDTSLSEFDAAFHSKEASRGGGTHLRRRRSPTRTVPNGSRHFHRLRRSRKNHPRSL